MIRKLIVKFQNRVSVQKIFVMLKPKTISDLKIIDKKFKIELVNKTHINLLQKFANNYRREGYFEDSLLPAIKNENRIGLQVIDTSNGRLAYICWISLKNEDIFNEYNLKLKANEAFILDAFTIPAYRRQGLHNRLMQERINHCIQNDKDVIYISIFNSNINAIKNIQQFQFKHFKSCYKIRLFEDLSIKFNIKKLI